jgi:transposase
VSTVRKRERPVSTVRKRERPVLTVRKRERPVSTVRKRERPVSTVRKRERPVSIVATGANRHDASQTGAALAAAARPKRKCKMRLCADAAHGGGRRAGIMGRHGCVPRGRGRREEAGEKRANPRAKARRWAVEAARGWLNRFRKLLARFEKMERSYLALCHLAAAIIVLRKIGLPENIIYG